MMSLFSKNPFSALTSDGDEPAWRCKECGLRDPEDMPTAWGRARRNSDPWGRGWGRERAGREEEEGERRAGGRRALRNDFETTET